MQPQNRSVQAGATPESTLSFSGYPRIASPQPKLPQNRGLSLYFIIIYHLADQRFRRDLFAYRLSAAT